MVNQLYSNKEIIKKKKKPGELAEFKGRKRNLGFRPLVVDRSITLRFLKTLLQVFLIPVSIPNIQCID